jgi:NAD(P)-dependent dehydrogenase (short-subunit alcohol dehydrogenase family)
MNDTNLIEDLRLLAPPSYGWVAPVVGAVVIVVLAMLISRAFRRSARVAVAVAGPAPWTAALAALEHLTPLLRAERSRDYGIEATGVLRGYIETRYGLHAPKLATEEFLAAAGTSPLLPAEHRASLGRFLELCDLFKFGRYVAAADELQQLHAAAVAFVLASRSPEAGA